MAAETRAALHQFDEPGATPIFRFGRIANELVEWFNAVDATYRAELREQNEMNFSRFDARLEQRMAELKTDLVRWMFAFWAPTALAIGALLLRR